MYKQQIQDSKLTDNTTITRPTLEYATIVLDDCSTHCSEQLDKGTTMCR